MAAAAACVSTIFCVTAFVATLPQVRPGVLAPARAPRASAQGVDGADATVGSTVSLGVAAAVCAVALGMSARTRQRSATRVAGVAVACQDDEYGEDLKVSGDKFVVLGLAHCFEQVEGKLRDVWVLEPMSASTVEVIENGAQTSYEAFIGTNVGAVLAQDISAYPEELLCGHEAQFAENLEFRTGCAARTWMREHAMDVVKAFAPEGKVRTGFNTSTQHKRILNFVNEVKDSDNIKQDMSIDVYGREDEDDKGKGKGKGDDGVDDEIAALYNVEAPADA
eukprot:CAMPEP_0170585514 /NCGR_PEP_ID=MMETSP0224-20130122/9254_1 /TAXON_ID=285029 /ORGANISM="Togula jolla, Strain CCCM 725" /LENGTH=278 /DNA_ID=CAMNT_0010909003 /DNA_START=75 /DNA_END=912 /DNA_ORIENTATION=+